MRAHTPQNLDVSRRRSSVSGSHRTSIGAGTSIPRPQSRIAVVRASNTQPTYDFFTGGERPPSRDSFRPPSRTSIGGHAFAGQKIDNEVDTEKSRKELDELKAELKSLKYTIENHKQEEELSRLRHESEIRDVRRKGEEDFKRMQQAEADKSKATRQYESLMKEFSEIRTAASNEKATIEKKVRDIEDDRRILEEELEDLKAEREDGSRAAERRVAEMESRNTALQQTVEELQQDSDRRETLLQDLQQKISQKDKSLGELEAEVLRLKAQTGDAETLGIIKRELSEQVTHIRALEATNREQASELKHYRQLHKSIEVVEEEKRSLQRRVDSIEGLENELGEARIQRQRLEDERLAWTAYLQSESSSEGQLEFDSPEALARALVQERLQTASLVERLGGIEPELSEKDHIISALETEKSKLTSELEKQKSNSTTSGGDVKAKQRLERQRTLAIKEVEYLRAQLKTFDAEDTTFQPENVDEAKVKRIQELEDIVDQYRKEVETLQGELASQESSPPAGQIAGLKRPHEEATADDERLGQLARKNRKLQSEMAALQNSAKLLQKELSVSKERLAAATEHSKTRILSLRSNPTSDFEAIKMSTLAALRTENADLLAQIQGGSGSGSRRSHASATTSVPITTLEAAQRDVRDAEEALRSEKKRNDRLKKVWLAKTQEFRELVVSLLGWDVVFLPNGKMRVTSYFYPSKGDDENSIVFDGEKGTMKVSGGPNSAFAHKIMPQIRFWVNERGSIPCLLAALTLEFYEEANRDGTLRVDV